MVRVRLQPIVHKLNLPTVLKTAILPGDTVERLFIATQVGEIFYIGDGDVRTFLDIRSRIIKLGESSGGYDERGLLGFAFHPEFHDNGLFYLHYSVAGTQGPGTGFDDFIPNPCDPNTLHLKWTNRETQYDHIDTVEEWQLQMNGPPQRRRTLLNLRRPFSNHNGVNSLNFSPETGKLVLTTGDGGSGFDPYHLAQNNMEIAGKIIEIDVSMHTSIHHPPSASRFNELPVSIQETLTLMAKGVRNITGIAYQNVHHHYIKYTGQVGQELVESIFSFVHYQPIPITHLVQASVTNSKSHQEVYINFGWRGWEGDLPTSIVKECSSHAHLNDITMAYYNEVIELSVRRLQPLTEYYHIDQRVGKFKGTALTGEPYMGNQIPALTGSVVFTDVVRRGTSPERGVLAYTRARPDGKLSDYSVIETDDDFGSEAAHYVSLGTNLNHTRLYLGVHGSMRVTDLNQGTVFEIVP